jgi:integrase
MNNVRRTLRKMLADAGLSHLDVSPHTFRRTTGTVIARATDAKTASEVMGDSEEIAQRHDIEPEAPVPHAAPAIHLQVLAPRESEDVARAGRDGGLPQQRSRQKYHASVILLP